MNRRVDPDALYRFLYDFHGVVIANAICPEVAEPATAKPYDYHADWTRHPDPSGNNDVLFTCDYCGRSRWSVPIGRHDCPEQPATPAEPIDEAVYEAASKIPGMGMGPARRQQIKVAVLKDRELRSMDKQPGDEVKPAPADDPRRLTDDEVLQAWDSGETVDAGLRAVADAQWERAKVTISEEEIADATATAYISASRDQVADLLRRHGVEVVP